MVEEGGKSMLHHHNHRHQSSGAVLIAFLANLGFAILELIFGILFNSSAILADSLHDTGDALAIGLAYYFERYSKKDQDRDYTLGYLRFSLLGAVLTASILIGGSLLIIWQNVPKIFAPEEVNHEGMLVLGVIAILVNLLASRVLHGERSEQEAILSLHFLEDTLGWLAVILVAVILRFRDWYFLDPLLSVLIALFILWSALPKFVKNLQVFLEKRPASLDPVQLEAQLLEIEGLKAIYQFNVWSLDGHNHLAMMHIQVADGADAAAIKAQIHTALRAKSVIQSAIELDASGVAHDQDCQGN